MSPCAKLPNSPVVRSVTRCLPLALALYSVAGAINAAHAADAAPDGACVLLHNGNVLFGDAEALGDWVTVRSGQGNVIRLRRDQVACWGESPRDLYRYRIENRREGDPDSYLREARWCLRYRLHDLAAAELQRLYRLDPDHEGAALLEQQLRSASRKSRGLHRSRSGSEVGSAEEQAEEPTVPLADFSIIQDPVETPPSEVEGVPLQLFARHVQPLLLNRCGRCHSHLTDREYQLLVPAGAQRPSARMTRENLASTLRYVTPDRPNKSPLLKMAKQPHGGGPAAVITPRESRTLEKLTVWARLAGRGDLADSSPDTPSPALATASYEDDGGAETALAGFDQPTSLPDDWDAGLTDPDVTEAVPRERPRKTPSRLPPVENPFDPELFNRRYHRD